MHGACPAAQAWRERVKAERGPTLCVQPQPACKCVGNKHLRFMHALHTSRPGAAPSLPARPGAADAVHVVLYAGTAHELA